MPIRNVFRRETSNAPLQPGERIYAIGDIHGRLDLLWQLMGQIEKDKAARGPARCRLVILGDFIDRGPDSARIATVLASQRAQSGVIVIKGNHEACMADGLAGDRGALHLWIEHGGDATLRSFGASDDDIYPADSRLLLGTVRRIVPKSIAKWITQLPTTYRAGQYLFVHAGIRPGVSLDRQVENDLLWIRDEFIQSTEDHGVTVVHGHTISEAGVCLTSNRIGVDTGAWRTGRLSAVALEGEAQWVLDTGAV